MRPLVVNVWCSSETPAFRSLSIPTDDVNIEFKGVRFRPTFERTLYKNVLGILEVMNDLYDRKAHTLSFCKCASIKRRTYSHPQKLHIICICFWKRYMPLHTGHLRLRMHSYSKKLYRCKAFILVWMNTWQNRGFKRHFYTTILIFIFYSVVCQVKCKVCCWGMLLHTEKKRIVTSGGLKQLQRKRKGNIQKQ